MSLIYPYIKNFVKHYFKTSPFYWSYKWSEKRKNEKTWKTEINLKRKRQKNFYCIIVFVYKQENITCNMKLHEIVTNTYLKDRFLIVLRLAKLAKLWSTSPLRCNRCVCELTFSLSKLNDPARDPVFSNAAISSIVVNSDGFCVYVFFIFIYFSCEIFQNSFCSFCVCSFCVWFISSPQSQF